MKHLLTGTFVVTAAGAVTAAVAAAQDNFLRRPEITAPTVRHRGSGRGRAITSHGSGTGHPAARSPDTSSPGPGARLQPRC